MPRLSELLKPPAEGTYTRVEPLSVLQHPPAEPVLPGFNPSLRCPMPATGTANPDSIRQFSRPGVSQFRVLTQK